MIKKCDHKNCEKPGIFRAPKSRKLDDYYFFCKEHAAEYNKNWNYFSNMTSQEIEDEWEKEVFGTAPKDAKAENDAADYAAFIGDFLTGRASFDKMPPAKKALSSPVSAALKLFGLPPTASKREVGAAYRALAKAHHPDTARNKKNAAAEFAKIAEAYAVLEKHFKKN
jgi:DnaJ-domain-containing protein 1